MTVAPAGRQQTIPPRRPQMDAPTATVGKSHGGEDTRPPRSELGQPVEWTHVGQRRAVGTYDAGEDG